MSTPPLRTGRSRKISPSTELASGLVKTSPSGTFLQAVREDRDRLREAHREDELAPFARVPGDDLHPLPVGEERLEPLLGRQERPRVDRRGVDDEADVLLERDPLHLRVGRASGRA